VGKFAFRGGIYAAAAYAGFTIGEEVNKLLGYPTSYYSTPLDDGNLMDMMEDAGEGLLISTGIDLNTIESIKNDGLLSIFNKEVSPTGSSKKNGVADGLISQLKISQSSDKSLSNIEKILEDEGIIDFATLNLLGFYSTILNRQAVKYLSLDTLQKLIKNYKWVDTDKKYLLDGIKIAKKRLKIGDKKLFKEKKLKEIKQKEEELKYTQSLEKNSINSLNKYKNIEIKKSKDLLSDAGRRVAAAGQTL